MIRLFWACAVAAGATLFFGTQVLVAPLLGVRGGFYARTTQRWARTILRATGARVQVHGAEHVAAADALVVVSNHVSALDIIAQAAVFPIPFHFLGKKELNSVPFFGRAWRAAGHISIDRSNRQSAMQSLQEAARRIRASGGKLIVYPEGTRSRTGELLPFKRGAFAIAVEAGAPVVPSAVVGTRGMIGPGMVLRPGPIHIVFGAPIPTRGADPSETDRLVGEAHARVSALLADSRALPVVHG